MRPPVRSPRWPRASVPFPRSTDTASSIAGELEQVARERGLAVQETINSIQQISEASSKVGEIVSVIGKDLLPDQYVSYERRYRGRARR